MKNIIQRKIAALLCCFLGMWLCCPAFPVSAGEGKHPDNPAGIVTVDIPYSLFLSLVTYQELTEKEKTGENINSEMIPVLESIVGYLRGERKKYENLLPSASVSVPSGEFLAHMDRHIEGFHKELLYRQGLAEYESLMEKQKKMIEKNE